MPRPAAEAFSIMLPVGAPQGLGIGEPAGPGNVGSRHAAVAGKDVGLLKAQATEIGGRGLAVAFSEKAAEVFPAHGHRVGPFLDVAGGPELAVKGVPQVGDGIPADRPEYLLAVEGDQEAVGPFGEVE